MLYSVLMNRIFGNEMLSGREFFNLFPRLHPFFLTQLTQATTQLTENKVEFILFCFIF